jgi:hypothetical protein
MHREQMPQREVIGQSKQMPQREVIGQQSKCHSVK